MKKISTSVRWQMLMRDRGERAAWNRVREALRRRGVVTLPQSRVTIRAPKHFSLVENTRATLRFFDEIEARADPGGGVRLQFKYVTRMTPDAVLYLLSRLKAYNDMPGFQIRGNAPKDLNCRRQWIGTGFFQSPLITAARISSEDPMYMRVRRGTQVDGKIAKEVIEFATMHLGPQENRLRRAVYKVIVESMSNTLHHASGQERHTTEWSLIARYDDQAQRVRFAFLDEGVGIPATVRRRVTERFVDSEDHELIESALLGQNRTQTHESHRGKGLPKINELYTNGDIRNLQILSRDGCVDRRSQTTYRLPQRFNGTLLCWDFATNGAGCPDGESDEDH